MRKIFLLAISLFAYQALCTAKEVKDDGIPNRKIIVMETPIEFTTPKIESIDFFVDGDVIIVKYDFTGTYSDDRYDIELSVSRNDRNWFRSLRRVSGDVGINQQGGFNKQIIWRALEEFGEIDGNLQFKIEAKCITGCGINHNMVYVEGGYFKMGGREPEIYQELVEEEAEAETEAETEATEADWYGEYGEEEEAEVEPEVEPEEEWYGEEAEEAEAETEETEKEVPKDQLPAHTVYVDDYYIGIYEVTIEEFRAFIEETGYTTDADELGFSIIINEDENGLHQETVYGVNWKCDVNGNIRGRDESNYPVIFVSWNDAVAYCEWLSEKTGENYRLPTEAEWEYAARGGQKSEGYIYSGSDYNFFKPVAWFADNSNGQLHSIGELKPNELGIYDMSGNVMEWCSDWYGKDYYSNETYFYNYNPQGPYSGEKRVIRGGSFIINNLKFTNLNRVGFPPSAPTQFSGFRVVLSPLEAPYED